MAEHTKIREFLRKLHSPFVGREEEARVVTLTLLSREHAVLIGEPGCVASDTLIALRDGTLAYIDSLLKASVPGIYSVNIPLHASHVATEWHAYIVPETVELTTRLGLRLRVTANHPLLTPCGWVRADALSPGTLVKLAPPAPSGRSTHTSLAAALAAFSAKPRLKSTGNRYSIFECPVNLLHYDVTVLRTHGAAVEAGGRRVLVNGASPQLLEGLRSLTLGRLPSVALEGGASLAAFLAGVVRYYGSVERQDDGIRITIGSAVSEGITRALHAALVTYGVLAIYREDVKTRELVIRDRGSIARLCAFLRACGPQGRELHIMLESFLGKVWEALSQLPLAFLGGLTFDVVERVRVIKELTPVYDLHVPVTHSFVSNALVSHNTAKSAIVRRAAELLNAKFFKYLLTRFTEPAELFGPLDIRALEEGRYVRLVRGKLPDADIAFLDEIFKANSAILNALNSLLQERVLYDGFTEMRVPLWSLFGASNEVPDDPEVEALYDRFLARHFVRPVPEDYWGDLLSKAWGIEKRMYYEGGLGDGAVMSVKELRALHKRVLNVDLEPVKSKLIKLFAVFESRGIKVTDRRKGKSLKMIAANAVLEGRDSAEERDLIVLKYVIPRDWDELDKVNMILSEELKTPYKYLKELEEIRNNVREVMNYVLSLEGISSRYLESRYRLMLKDLEVAKARVVSIGKECSDRRVRKVVNDVISLIEDAENAINRRIR